MPSDIRMAVQSSVSTYLWHFWQKMTSSASSMSVFPGKSEEFSKSSIVIISYRDIIIVVGNVDSEDRFASGWTEIPKKYPGESNQLQWLEPSRQF